MYSPKIREDYIPYLYKLARHLGLPMTALVNEILCQVIEHFKAKGTFAEIEEGERLARELAAHLESLVK